MKKRNYQHLGSKANLRAPMKMASVDTVKETETGRQKGLVYGKESHQP